MLAEAFAVQAQLEASQTEQQASGQHTDGLPPDPLAGEGQTLSTTHLCTLIHAQDPERSQLVRRRGSWLALTLQFTELSRW